MAYENFRLIRRRTIHLTDPSEANVYYLQGRDMYGWITFETLNYDQLSALEKEEIEGVQKT